jgi:hypothetical protein
MATKKTTRTKTIRVKKTAASQKVSAHGEQRSGPIAGTALVDGATFSQKALQYAVVDGMAIFEGDIILGTAEQMQAMDVQAARSIGIPATVNGHAYRWPGGKVPYEIASTLPNQSRVTDAIAHWQANTTIRFILRTSANASQYPDYVRFVSGSGCSSSVGRQGGMQNVTLGSSCTAGNCIHEIGHTIGLWHEQSREDRNSWVTINWANIDPAMQHNFNQQISDGDDLGAYDYGSIMHYPRTAFTINGQDTIVPKQTIPAGVVMGQRSGLSAGDLAGVRLMYPTLTTVKEVRKDPVLETVKEVRKEPTIDTVKEVRKDPTLETVKEVRKEPVLDTVKEAVRDTVKEAAFDPINPGPLVVNPAIRAAASPFVLASPSRALGGVGATGDPTADLQEHIRQLEEAIALLDQQMAQLLEAYEQAQQQLQGQV